MGDLNCRRILIVEDSPVVAAFATTALEELGCVVIGPAQNMAVARELATNEQIDAAIVDIRIRGEKAFSICEILAARDIPFVLATGYADSATPEKWRNRMQLSKPYKLEDFRQALIEVL